MRPLVSAPSLSLLCSIFLCHAQDGALPGPLWSEVLLAGSHSTYSVGGSLPTRPLDSDKVHSTRSSNQIVSTIPCAIDLNPGSVSAY